MFRRTRRAAVRDSEQKADSAHVFDEAVDEPFADDEPLPDAHPEVEPPIEAAWDATPALPVLDAPIRTPDATPMNVRAYEPGPSTVIGPATSIEGTVRTPDDLRVEGSISGTLDVRGTLVIARGGSVDAEVDAYSIRVEGRLSGDIRCRERLEAADGSHIDGSFTTEVLVVVEGAVVTGKFAMRARSAAAQTRAQGEMKDRA